MLDNKKLRNIKETKKKRKKKKGMNGHSDLQEHARGAVGGQPNEAVSGQSAAHVLQLTAARRIQPQRDTSRLVALLQLRGATHTHPPHIRHTHTHHSLA